MRVVSGHTPELDVTLVVVAYRSRRQVEALLTGLPDDLPAVVVDNSDGSDGLPELIAARPNSQYVVGGGVGFARAANAGARAATTETLVFLNPDTRPTPSQLTTLVHDVVTEPDLATSAAILVDEAGRTRIGAGGWEPNLRRAVVHAVGLHKLAPRAGLFATPVVGEPLDVDWVSGAVMAVRRSTFQRLGGFDESFYVYNEDMAFGRTAREHGMHERLRTDVTVRGDSGGSGAPSLEMMRLRGASLTRYVRGHHPRPRATAISLCVAMGYVVRMLDQLLRRDVSRAREHWAYAVGAITARASVAGRVVTQ